MHPKFIYKTALSTCALSLLLGCAATSTAPHPAADSQATASFRVRSDFHAPLDSDLGWAGNLNENVPITADQPFRIRFEIEQNEAKSPHRSLLLQYRRNAGEWTDIAAHDFPYPETDDAESPRVSIVSCPAYANADATTDLLKSSPLPFAPGSAISLARRAKSRSRPQTHSEYEWAIVVRRFADGAVTNEAGDRFEFRIAGQRGQPLAASVTPSLALTIPPRHLGGTFVETPGRIGPWQASNGDLYCIMEPTETDNRFMMMKSSVAGATWREIDGPNRPKTGDLESVDGRLLGDTIHIIHQITQSTHYHVFRTSDHPTHPDTWALTDEIAGTVNSIAQGASLVARSDGSLVAFYVGQGKIHYSIRNPSGVWRDDIAIDPASKVIHAGPQAVLGRDDATHLVHFAADGSIIHRKLSFDGQLAPPTVLSTSAGKAEADYGAVLPLCYLDQTDTLVAIYRQNDGFLWERRITGEQPPSPPVKITDRPVITDAVDSQQPAADAIADGTTIHLLFIDQESRSIFHATDRNGWSSPSLQVDSIQGSWIRGNSNTRKDGTKVLSYIYDAGSKGGAGMNRYAEIALD